MKYQNVEHTEAQGSKDIVAKIKRILGKEWTGMEDKFIQIIPASENLFSKSYIEEDGVYLYSPIVCMALTSDGDIKFCDMDGSGYIDEIDTFMVVKYLPELDEYVELFDFEKEWTEWLNVY